MEKQSQKMPYIQYFKYIIYDLDFLRVDHV